MSKYNLLRPLLTDYAISRRNSDSMFIAKKVAPVTPVTKDSAYYPVWGNESLQESASKGLRPSGSEAEKVKLSVSPTQYVCKERSFEFGLDEQDRDDADKELDLEMKGTRLVTDKLMLHAEIDCAAKLFNATTFASYTAALGGVTQWSHASSVPSVQVAAAKASILLNGVVDPDQVSLIIGAEVWAALQVNANLRAQAQYTHSQILSKQLVAEILGVKEVIVGYGVKENEITGVRSQIWDKYALFAYLSPNATKEDVSTAKMFVPKGKDIRIEKYINDAFSSDMIRGKQNWDIEVTAVSSGYLFTAAVA